MTVPWQDHKNVGREQSRDELQEAKEPIMCIVLVFNICLYQNEWAGFNGSLFPPYNEKYKR